jgi:hypothetical protein
MNKTEIAQQIKETEEKLAALRLELEKPEYPTLEDSKPGDKLKDGCIVVHKFEETRMALIAAPKSTDRYCKWSKEFSDVFDALQQEGFNRSQWFIPNVEQLMLAYMNCQDDFLPKNDINVKGEKKYNRYWSSTEASVNSYRDIAVVVGYCDGIADLGISKEEFELVRAFSLVSY